eukprot:6222730-Alexandrium_andersonii.AAC.1
MASFYIHGFCTASCCSNPVAAVMGSSAHSRLPVQGLGRSIGNTGSSKELPEAAGCQRPLR